MRVNPNPLADLLSAISEAQQQINKDLEQLATGQSINSPGENPAGAAMLVRNAGQTAEADQFLRSVSGLSSQMQNTDSALNSVVTSLQRAVSLGVEGANGTLNSSDRTALATEVQGIQSELLNLANLSYQGNFVFAGSAISTAPYVADPTSASGVRYVGNSAVNTVTLGNHLALKANMPGSELFSGNGADMFQAVQDLITSLQNGANIDSAVAEVSNAYNHVNAQRVFYGNAMNQLGAQQTFLNNETTELAQQQNTIGGADLTKVISDLVNAQTSRQATLEAVAQTQQTNLFNYIK
ncbi:MAG TPA: flagellar hook-associated protein FlgL [Candidatus Sulfotelmatobacter sp.]|nr:flagellar hook-associated protein FlgL [Candidatus Sulfotelmatobacter sp.]